MCHHVRFPIRELRWPTLVSRQTCLRVLLRWWGSQLRFHCRMAPAKFPMKACSWSQIDGPSFSYNEMLFVGAAHLSALRIFSCSFFDSRFDLVLLHIGKRWMWRSEKTTCAEMINFQGQQSQVSRLSLGSFCPVEKMPTHHHSHAAAPTGEPPCDDWEAARPFLMEKRAGLSLR